MKLHVKLRTSNCALKSTHATSHPQPAGHMLLSQYKFTSIRICTLGYPWDTCLKTKIKNNKDMAHILDEVTQAGLYGIALLLTLLLKHPMPFIAPKHVDTPTKYFGKNTAQI